MKLTRLGTVLAALCLLTACGGRPNTTPAAESAPGSVSAPAEKAPAEESVPEAADGAESVTGDRSQGADMENALSWTVETKQFTTSNSKGKALYQYTFTYPVFSGEHSETLNNIVRENWLGDMKKHQDVVDDDYEKELLEYGYDQESLDSMLPFFDELSLDVSYADEHYVSLVGTAGFWSGGAHPYSYTIGAVLRLPDGESVAYTDLLKEPERLSELIRADCAEQGLDEETVDGLVERIEADGDPEGFSLEEGGLRLFYNIGDAVPRLEVLIPNSELNL